MCGCTCKCNVSQYTPATCLCRWALNRNLVSLQVDLLLDNNSQKDAKLTPKHKYVFSLNCSVWSSRCVFFLLIKPRPVKPVPATTLQMVFTSGTCQQTTNEEKMDQLCLTQVTWQETLTYPFLLDSVELRGVNKLNWDSPGTPRLVVMEAGSVLHLKTWEL